MKKILTALLIGAFVFGVSVSDVNFANAKSADRDVAQTQEATHHAQDGHNPPEPPKDSDGKPLPPSDNNGSDTRHHDGQKPPEPPKDSDGKPLPPPDRNGNETENHDGHTPTEHGGNDRNQHQQK